MSHDDEKFIMEMRRYLKSGNTVPVTQVTLPAAELEKLIEVAEDYFTRYECSRYED